MHLKVEHSYIVVSLKIKWKTIWKWKRKEKDVSQLEAESLAKLRQCTVGDGGTQTMGIRMLITNFFGGYYVPKERFLSICGNV